MLPIRPVDYQLSIDTYKAIAFTDIQDFYPLNVDLTCSFKRVRHEFNFNKDFIGIYKVGWRRLEDYIAKVILSSDNRKSVLFNGRYSVNKILKN